MCQLAYSLRPQKGIAITRERVFRSSCWTPKGVRGPIYGCGLSACSSLRPYGSLVGKVGVVPPPPGGHIRHTETPNSLPKGGLAFTAVVAHDGEDLAAIGVA